MNHLQKALLTAGVVFAVGIFLVVFWLTRVEDKVAPRMSAVVSAVPVTPEVFVGPVAIQEPVQAPALAESSALTTPSSQTSPSKPPEDPEKTAEYEPHVSGPLTM